MECCNMVTVENSYNSNNEKISLKISLVGTPFLLNCLCGNAVPMRSRPTTPLIIMHKLVLSQRNIQTLKKTIKTIKNEKTWFKPKKNGFLPTLFEDDMMDRSLTFGSLGLDNHCYPYI